MEEQQDSQELEKQEQPKHGQMETWIETLEFLSLNNLEQQKQVLKEADQHGEAACEGAQAEVTKARKLKRQEQPKHDQTETWMETLEFLKQNNGTRKRGEAWKIEELKRKQEMQKMKKPEQPQPKGSSSATFRRKMIGYLKRR